MADNIVFFYRDVAPLFGNEEGVSTCLREVAEAEGKSIQRLHFIFCSEAHLYRLNVKYLQHHTHTDVLTFDYTGNEGLSGELFLSVPRIGENAKRYKVTFISELWRVMVHGLLHLAGYQDDTLKQRECMRRLEDRHIRRHLPVVRQCSTGNIRQDLQCLTSTT